MKAATEGRSEPFTLHLPERAFTKPLAKALIEQRRNLALDARVRSQVITVVDALTLGPDKFRTEAGIYLELRSNRLNQLLEELRNRGFGQNQQGKPGQGQQGQAKAT